MRTRAVLFAAVVATCLTGGAAAASTTDGTDVTGSVWLDLDGDGEPDEDEPGRAGVQVQLRTASSILDAMTTDRDGTYTFSNVQPGTYVVEVTTPIDHVISGGSLKELDRSTGEGSVRVGSQPVEAGSVGLASPVSSGPDVTTTVALDNMTASASDYTWVVETHNMGPEDADGPLEVRIVLSRGHEAVRAAGADWTCESAATIVLCETDEGLGHGTTAAPIALVTSPSGELGSTVTVTATTRLDGSFDAAPLNDEGEADGTIAADRVAADIDGDGVGDLTNAGAATTGLLVAALFALLAGGTALRTQRRP